MTVKVLTLTISIILYISLSFAQRPSYAGSRPPNGHKDKYLPIQNTTNTELTNRFGGDSLANGVSQRPPQGVPVVTAEQVFIPITNNQVQESGVPPLSNRFSSVANENGIGVNRIPLDAHGDQQLIDHLNQIPIDNRPFWFINYQAIEAQRNNSIQRPKTIYGVSKVHAELIGEYYYHKFGLDFRCLRFPGVISSDIPGGGTTDYAISMFHESFKNGKYTCYLRPNTMLPMMYIKDCVRSLLEFMTAPQKQLKRRVYNVTGVSFTPQELVEELSKFVPNFHVIYQPDDRQLIADSWPQVLDDSEARNDWGWKPQYSLQKIVESMVNEIQKNSNNLQESDMPLSVVEL